MKTYGGVELYSTILDPAVDGSDQHHALAALPPRKEPQYPLDRRLDGPQSRSGHCEVEAIFLPLSGIELRPSNP
jgi:hypothetical protein